MSSDYAVNQLVHDIRKVSLRTAHRNGDEDQRVYTLNVFHNQISDKFNHIRAFVLD